MSPNAISLFSPAKLNLFFRVLRRRSDGYCEIASLFQAISLGDALEIKLSDRDQLTCNDPTLPCDSSNLVLKASDLFRRKTGLNVFASIHLEKRIPIQAGLGGGSGNAATTLWALNHLQGSPATENDLALWAGEIGSDTSFFLSLGTAYCTGRGEILEPKPSLQHKGIWLAKPSFGMPTPAVYRQWSESQPIDPRLALASFYDGEPMFFNDLEKPAIELSDGLLDLKMRLLAHGYQTVCLTGSGSAFFCIGDIPPPTWEGISFYQVDFISRKEGQWYNPNL